MYKMGKLVIIYSVIKYLIIIQLVNIHLILTLPAAHYKTPEVSYRTTGEQLGILQVDN